MLKNTDNLGSKAWLPIGRLNTEKRGNREMSNSKSAEGRKM